MPQGVNGRPPGRVNRRRAARADEVMEVSARLFHERGYEATSIQDIADALGILKGSLYHYIDSKDDLLYTLLAETHRALLINVDAVRQMDADPLEKLTTLIRRHIELMLHERVKARIYLHDFRSLSDSRQRDINAMRLKLSEYMEELIKQGQSEGLIAEDLDPWLASLGILGMLNWTHEWYRPTHAAGQQRIINGLTDLAIRCVLPVPRRS